MTWFKKHLNWTAAIGVILWIIILAIYDIKYATEAGLTVFIFPLISLFADGFTVVDIVGLLFTIIGLAICIPISIWVLKKKHRPLWWVMIIFLSIGWIFFPLLGNRSEVLDIVDGKLITRPRNEND